MIFQIAYPFKNGSCSVFLIFVLIDSIPFNYTIALAVFAAASITDALDGHIARKNNLDNKLWKIS